MLDTENKIILQKYFYTSKIEPNLDLKEYIHLNDSELGINVKWHHPKFHKDMVKTEIAGDKIIDVFWYKANQIAMAYGYAACLSSGRSGGWAIPQIKVKNSNKVTPFTYQWNNTHELDYQIQLKIFTMFAHDIKSLFNLIDKEIRNIKTLDELDRLIDGIYDL